MVVERSGRRHGLWGRLGRAPGEHDDEPRRRRGESPCTSGTLLHMSNRTTLPSVVASAVVGVVLGVVGVIGVAAFSGQNSVPVSNAVPADEAVLGGPEYGAR